MYVLRTIARRADAALFGNIAARAAWAILGTALGLWQGPITMIVFAFGLIAVSETLNFLSKLPASRRQAPRPQVAIRTGQIRTV
ncbi:hypothetical protein D3874_27015 [Oleomonas cavernae]|uniref:Uncharacterized protein n=1 Tax=Oleomonas cavernae TaxID=2320859 RepID=A0A418VUC5_9PROT|nr:hypothetical protein [Oleomonas cavernae]RJF80743.1 hypothetical protein D3874_27015 [Oleomonas cavernae]